MKAYLILGFAILSSTLFAQQPDDITGLWLVEDKDAYIRIYAENDKYFGKVTWIEEPYDEDGNPQTDPDGEPVLEMEIMKNFKFEEGEWVDGTIYDAQEGKTYYGSIEMKDTDTLELRGSVDSFGILGRTETWTRIQEK